MIKHKFLFFILLSAMLINPGEIKNFQVFTGIIDNSFITLRSFDEQNVKKILAVNPKTLRSAIFDSNKIKFDKKSFSEIKITFRDSPYIRIIESIRKDKNEIRNAGLRHIYNAPGFFLTADLCPSKNTFDRYLFDDLVKHFGSVKKIPIGLSLSWLWAKKHPDDLEHLKSLDKKNDLEIIWINHTLTHDYDERIPDEQNFLLLHGTDITKEILENEKMMLENGITPSVFFRFPGLISNRGLINKILDYGLIPLGADAWLAKGENPKSGSIILIHANGNEEQGIKILLDYIDKNKTILESIPDKLKNY